MFRALLSALVVTTAFAQCGRSNAASCTCETEVMVVLASDEGAFSANIDDWLEQLAFGLLQHSSNISLGLGACDTNFSNLRGITSSTSGLVAAIQALNPGPGEPEPGNCADEVFDAFSGDAVRNVAVFVLGRSHTSSPGLDAIRDLLTSKGVEVFVFFPDDNIDDVTLQLWQNAVTFPPSTHMFYSRNAARAQVAASAIAGALVTQSSSYACSLYGAATHVATYDGVPYHFQGVGEFWLSLSGGGDMDAQVRLEKCLGSREGKQTTCATAFALKSGADVVEFERLRSSGRLVVRYGGTLQVLEPTLRLGDFNVDLHPRHVTADREGWQINVNTDRMVVRIAFTSYGAGFTLIPSASLRGNVEGLCGNYNGCHNDEFMSRDGVLYAADDAMGQYWAGESYRVSEEETLFTHRLSQRYPPPMDFTPDTAVSAAGSAVASAGCADLGAYVTGGCSFDLGVHGGPEVAVVSHYMFFELCDLFCMTGVSLHGFLDADSCSMVCDGPSAEAQSLNVRETYDDDNLPETVLEGGDGPSALFHARSNLGGQYTLRLNVTSSCSLQQKEVVVNLACHPNAFSVDAGSAPNVDITPVGYGEVRLDASAGNLRSQALRDGRGVLMEWIFTKLPFSVLDPHRTTHGPAVDDASQIRTFRRETLANVLNETLPWQEIEEVFDSAGITVPADFEELVEVAPELWDAVLPTVRGKRSTMARFQPMHPGSYDLTFAATDGCQLVSDAVSILALCPDCAPLAAIEGSTEFSAGRLLTWDPARYLVPSVNWMGPDRNSFDVYTFLARSRMHESLGEEGAITFAWSLGLLPADMSREHSYINTFTSQGVLLTNNTMPSSLLESGSGMQTYDATITKSPGLGDVSPDWFRTDMEVSPFECLDESDTDIRPVDPLFEAAFKAPPFTYTHALRQWALFETQQTTDSWNYEAWTRPTGDTLCQIHVQNAGPESISFNAPEVELSVSNYADPLDCEGTYRLWMDAWGTCERQTDFLDIRVTCGAPPVSIINCLPDVDFNYNHNEFGNPIPGAAAGSFPELDLFGKMSYVSSMVDNSTGTDDLDFRWSVVSWPADADPDNVDFRPSRFAQDPTVVLDRRAGDYVIELEVDDGCQTHTSQRTVTGFCEEPAPVVILTPDPGASTTLIFNGSSDPADFGLVLNASESTWIYKNDSLPFGRNIEAEFSFSFVSRPAPEDAIYCRVPSIGGPCVNQRAGQIDIFNQSVAFSNIDVTFSVGPQDYLASFAPTLPGDWILEVVVDDGCRLGRRLLTATAECPLKFEVGTSADIRQNLESFGGRVYLLANYEPSCTFNPACTTNPVAYRDGRELSFEWIWVTWPGQETGADPPNLDGTNDLNPLAQDTIVDTTTLNLTSIIDEYHPFNNTAGLNWSLPSSKVGANYDPISRNPCPFPDCTSFVPRVVGLYELALVVYDGCLFRTTFDDPVANDGENGHQEVLIDACQAFSAPTIGSFSNSTFRLGNAGGEPLYLFAEDPNVGTFSSFTYEWSVVSAPNASRCNPDTDPASCDALFVTPTNQLNVQFEPDKPTGDFGWVFQFTISVPQCGVVSVQHTVTVDCSLAPILITELSTSVGVNGADLYFDHAGGHFPLVELTGEHGPPTVSTADFDVDVDYFWTVTSAPVDSTYYPQCYSGSQTLGADRTERGEFPSDSTCVYSDFALTNATFEISNGSDPDILLLPTDAQDTFVYPNDTDVMFNVTTAAATETKWQSFAQLTPLYDSARYLEHDQFRACFFPDVAGVYELQLRVSVACGDTFMNIQFTANCNSTLPTTPSPTSGLIGAGTQTMPLIARYFLDASAIAMAASGVRVNFWWDWMVADFDDETFTLEELEFIDWVYNHVPIYNNDHYMASFVGEKVGTYYPMLWVTDNCETVMVPVDPVLVACQGGSANDFPGETISYGQVNFGAAGVSYFLVDLEEQVPNHDVGFCEQEYTWEVVGYDPEFTVVPLPAPTQLGSAARSSWSLTVLLFTVAVAALN